MIFLVVPQIPVQSATQSHSLAADKMALGRDQDPRYGLKQHLHIGEKRSCANMCWDPATGQVLSKVSEMKNKDTLSSPRNPAASARW